MPVPGLAQVGGIFQWFIDALTKPFNNTMDAEQYGGGDYDVPQNNQYDMDMYSPIGYEYFSRTTVPPPSPKIPYQPWTEGGGIGQVCNTERGCPFPSICKPMNSPDYRSTDGRCTFPSLDQDGGKNSICGGNQVGSCPTSFECKYVNNDFQCIQTSSSGGGAGGGSGGGGGSCLTCGTGTEERNGQCVPLGSGGGGGGGGGSGTCGPDYGTCEKRNDVCMGGCRTYIDDLYIYTCRDKNILIDCPAPSCRAGAMLINGGCVISGGGGGSGGGGNECGAQFGVCPADKTCVKKCGEPVFQIGDLPPTPGYSCLSSIEIKNRNQYGCPKCLSSLSQIDTPNGAINVKDLKIGAMVWTRNAQGKKIAAPILKTSKVPVSKHKVIHLVLTDGRSLDVSAPHPTANGKLVGDLKAGDWYDGSIVKSATLISYTGSATYDLLPAGDTGYYFANGIVMGSTLK